ncbi:MAG: cell division protein FtsA [Salinispira sp.]
MARGDIITGLDIGTSQICVMIGERNDKNEIEILGVGESFSSGLRKGVVINIELTQQKVLEAIEKAEQMAGRKVETATVGISGTHIEGLNSRGVVAVNSKGREITQNDVNRVMEAAQAVVLPMDREIIHLLPQEYLVDDQRGVKDPRDMIGVRLEAEVHLITALVTAAQNLVKCINRAGFRVSEMMYEGLAAVEAALTPEEKEIGTLFINIGGGTTDVILYLNGAPHYTAVLPLGGRDVTSDLSIILKTSLELAEQIKVHNGFAHASVLREMNTQVIVPGIAGRPPLATDQRTLCTYIEPRMTEIFEIVKHRVEKEGGFRNWPALGGVVLCGGGAMLPGTAELAQMIFHSSGRIAEPLGVQGLTQEVCRPDRATAYGLVLRGAENISLEGTKEPRTKKTGKLRNWLRNFFE